MFSNWTTTYNEANKEMTQNLDKINPRSEIPEWFKSKYHDYHNGFYHTEHTKSLGIYGDNPTEKFFPDEKNKQVQGKLNSDNFELSRGTTKASSSLPGFLGHIPVNKKEAPVNKEDSYFNVLKTNHRLNYNVKVPGYKGYVPKNPQNIKGNTRPYCLSTENETFS
jgi:hypothetical protein